MEGIQLSWFGKMSPEPSQAEKAMISGACLKKSPKLSGGYIPAPPDNKWTNAGEVMGEGYSIAWRVLDAQYWGVPQRRRRIYLVADFAGGRAGKILFERESVSGHSSQSGDAREGAAADAERGVAGNCSLGCPFGLNRAPSMVYPTVARCLTAEADASPCMDRGQNIVVLDRRKPVVYDARGNGDGANAPTLTGDHENRVTDYTCVVCMATGQANAEIANDMVPTLTAGHEHPIIAHDFRPTRQYIVRRLTPTECARLQGFPDDWGIPDRKEVMTEQEVVFWEGVRKTHAGMNGRAYRPCKDADALVKWYNKLHTDSSEYKMWGNGIALPCAAFVLGGVAEVMS